MRRRDLLAISAAPLLAAKPMTPRERVDAALAGKQPDRPPISLWHHFGLEKDGPERHASATLKFHKDYSTDLVKVMSDFPYPRPAGKWYELKVEPRPFAPQLRALEIIGNELKGRSRFVETIFNPWNVAEKLSSPEEVHRLRREQPQKLLDALEIIAKSESNHARDAIARGASGVFLAVANAQTNILTPEEYRRFSEPFDRAVLAAASGAPLNILHIHGEKAYVEHFLSGWSAAVNYGAAETGYAMKKAREKFGGLLLGGIDQRVYRSTPVPALQRQLRQARQDCGARWIATPGCSVPNESLPVELRHLAEAVTSL